MRLQGAKVVERVSTDEMKQVIGRNGSGRGQGGAKVVVEVVNRRDRLQGGRVVVEGREEQRQLWRLLTDEMKQERDEKKQVKQPGVKK